MKFFFLPPSPTGRRPQVAGRTVRRTVGRDRQIPEGPHRHPVPAAVDQGGQSGPHQGSVDKGGKFGQVENTFNHVRLKKYIKQGVSLDASGMLNSAFDMCT